MNIKKISLSLFCLVLISGCVAVEAKDSLVTSISKENKVTTTLDPKTTEVTKKEESKPNFKINDQEAKKVVINKYFSLYKDVSAGTSFFSAYNNGDYHYSNDIAQIINDNESVASYRNESIVKSVFFNHVTGKIIEEIDGEIISCQQKDDINNYVVSNQYAYLAKDSFYFLYDLEKKRIVNDQYSIETPNGPAFRLPFITNDNQHFPVYSVVSNDRTKIGLMDINGKIAIELKYDSLYFHESDKYLVAKSNGKYGLIDLMGNEILPFKYDFCEPYANYIVASLNNKLYVYNSELVPITIGKFDIGKYKYQEHLCCENRNIVEFKYLDIDKAAVLTLLDPNNIYETSDKVDLKYYKKIVIAKDKYYEFSPFNTFAGIKNDINTIKYFIELDKSKSMIRIYDLDFRIRVSFKINETNDYSRAIINAKFINKDEIEFSIYKDGGSKSYESSYTYNLSNRKLTVISASN